MLQVNHVTITWQVCEELVMLHVSGGACIMVCLLTLSTSTTGTIPSYDEVDEEDEDEPEVKRSVKDLKSMYNLKTATAKGTQRKYT